jgi:hypothetical protein
VVAELHADPKGAVAAWLVNLFQKNWDYNTRLGHAVRHSYVRCVVREEVPVTSMGGAVAPVL